MQVAFLTYTMKTDKESIGQSFDTAHFLSVALIQILKHAVL